MVEYIEREAAIVRACKAIQDDFIAFDVKEAIKEIPAADVVPVVHGKWRDTGSWQECSICKEIQYGYDTGRNYCHNCGADMREAEHGWQTRKV